MILLDTDVLTLVQQTESPEGLRVRALLLQLPDEESYATTIVSYEEQMRGWLKKMAMARTADETVAVYGRLLRHVANYRVVDVVPFDRSASDEFDRLRKLKIRIGTADLRIAATALSLDATLITRNLHDFTKVPNLRVEDWTKP